MRVETSSIKDLQGIHRMGHTCANLNGELFFVWGGTDERVAFLTSKNNHLWIYETLTGYCRHRSCSGECPPYLSGTASCLIGQKMFIFGGHSTVLDNWLNSLYCLDLETFIWKDLGSQAKFEPTKPIRSDKYVSWSYKNRLYVFGGYGWSQTEHLLQLQDKQKDLQLTPDYRWPKFGWNNQLVEYNPADNTWRWPSYSGKCPSARAAHSGALVGSKYYLFGGRDSRERLNDLYSFDMDTFEWQQIAVFSPDPLNGRVVRPLRHLLESADEDEDTQEAIGVVDEHQEALTMELTPTPSASTHPHEYLSSDDDEEEEEDDDETGSETGASFEYPHPSHLLERWSLSSHHSATSSNMDTANCLRQHSTDETNDPTSSYVHAVDSRQFIDNAQVSAENNSHQQTQQEQDLNPVNQVVENLTISEETPVPLGRSFASFTRISDHEILLYGGVSSQDENLADCWIFNTKQNSWIQVDTKTKYPRLWHTGSRTKSNEVVIFGGSCSDKIDEFCTDVLTLSLEPKSLKRLALDTVSRSVRMSSVHRVDSLPSTICKLIKLRKQAMALTKRGYQRPSIG